MNSNCEVCQRDLEIHDISVDFIVPLYKSAEHIKELFERVNEMSSDFDEIVSLVLVMDGPDENTEREIALHKACLKVQLSVLVLSRNFGVGPALLAGLSESKACVSMCFGSDLQEPASIFKTFFEMLRSNEADIALGNRLSREDPFLSKLGAAVYWWIYRRFINPAVPKGGFDVFALNRQARCTITELRELNTSITSQIGWIGFRQKYVPFHREARAVGKSSWTIIKKAKLFTDSIFGFTFIPITVITIIGFLSTAFFLTVTALTLIGSILGLVNVQGYTTLVILVGLGNSVVILSLGVVGSYISRAFDNSKQRPNFVVMRRF
jgi:glycosyltransferase involved in cell wall biosynthesis